MIGTLNKLVILSVSWRISGPKEGPRKASALAPVKDQPRHHSQDICMYKPYKFTSAHSTLLFQSKGSCDAAFYTPKSVRDDSFQEFYSWKLDGMVVYCKPSGGSSFISKHSLDQCSI